MKSENAGEIIFNLLSELTPCKQARNILCTGERWTERQRALTIGSYMTFSANTGSVEVSVTPVFLDDRSSPEDNMFFWAYTVTIENRGQAPIQLKSRHWRITDGNGRLHEVQGQGVVGEQPVIGPGEAYEYSSGCPLTTPSGLMGGEYTMQDVAGGRFQIAIPLFSLDSPYADTTVN